MSHVLETGEEIITIIRHSLFSYLGTLVIILLIFFLPLFFMIPLFKLGGWGIGIFCASIILGVVLALRVWWQVVRNYLILTNINIIDVDKRKLGKPSVNTFSLGVIQGVKCVQQGVRQKVFGYGDVAFKLDGVDDVLLLRKVLAPQRVKDIISNAVEAYWSSDKSGEAPSTNEKMVEILRKMKQRVGDDEFAKMFEKVMK